MRVELGVAALLVGGLTACNAITGVDDYQFGTGSGAASGTGGQSTTSATGGGTSVTTTTTTTGVGGAGGAGGGTGCDPLTQKSCSQSCVALDDPAFGCDAASCTACAAGSDCCPSCQDVTTNPTACGSCTNNCDADEWCQGSMCKCRPGLVAKGTACVDPSTDGAACGGGAACSGGTPLCQGGTCVAACSGGTTACSGGCFDLDTSPLHCGSCPNSCAEDEVCISGSCFQYQGSAGCSSCPCPGKCEGDFDICCLYPSSSTPICVNHDAPGCP